MGRCQYCSEESGEYGYPHEECRLKREQKLKSGLCDLCATSILGNDKHKTTQHIECVVEWKRRYDNGKCVKCDKRSRLEDSHLCGVCDKSFPYDKYPGGST